MQNNSRLLGVLYASAIFISAFLLFLVEPIAAKIILPWFGGTSAVWSACLLFFQAFLLIGYLYAHWLHTYVPARTQVWIHVTLLGLSALLVGGSSGIARIDGIGDPLLRVIATLTLAIGLPYFLLSTTSPLLQAWYGSSNRVNTPYRLYALSNVASVAALLAYPFLIEPRLSTRLQFRIWAIAYVAFAAITAVIACYPGRSTAVQPVLRKAASGERPTAVQRILWTILPACASVLLLATTAYLTQDVAAVPFLWLLPLSAYLLTFIVAFEAPQLYNRAVFHPLALAALAAFGYLLWAGSQELKVVRTVALVVSALFLLCMVCHGEMVRIRPATEYLTSFYLMMSVGGALGGVFVSLIAPRVFSSMLELPIGLALCLLLMVVMLWRGYPRFFAPPAGKVLAGLMLAVVFGYAGFLGYTVRDYLANSTLVVRNFYGQLRLKESDPDDGLGKRRKLFHGVIEHGEQILDAEKRDTPATYYCKQTPVGLLLDGMREPEKPGKRVRGLQRVAAKADAKPVANSGLRVGVLGLGCGTLLAYGHAGDSYRLYEINPMVVKLAREQFYFLTDTKAQVDVVLGDARLSLEQEPPQKFDALVLDAFSGDSIPVHLLTLEAFDVYFRHLKPNGVLAVHISNKYLDLRPVIARAAQSRQKLAMDYSFEADDDDQVCWTADWVLVTNPENRERLPKFEDAKVLSEPSAGKPWTDDYSSLWPILR